MVAVVVAVGVVVGVVVAVGVAVVMRTKSTPWNRSYKRDLAQELISKRPRGIGRTKAQQAAKRGQQRTFRIHEEPKEPVPLPEEWKTIGRSRKRAMESVEDRQLAEELREVWE